MTWQQALEEAQENHIVPAFHIKYFMTHKEYTRALQAIDCYWNCTSSHTFWKQKISTSIVGQLVIVKINP
jgi:hypothetical protein